jgi:hypothetical protein
MTVPVLDAASMARLAKKYRDVDTPTAAAELAAMGVAPRQMAVILDKSLSHTYRLVRKLGSLTIEAAGDDDVDHPSRRKITEEEAEVILSGTYEGFLALYERYSEWGPLPEHLRPWVRSYFENPMLQITCPPGMGKSSIFSVWLVVYLLIVNRKERILLVSRSSDLAVQWVRMISDILSDSRIERDFGVFAPRFRTEGLTWSRGIGLLQVRGGAEWSVRARGSGQAVLGFRATRIHLDDVSSTQVAASPAEREREYSWVVNEVLTRLEPDGRVVNIGNRLGLHDLPGMLGDLVETTGPLFHWERHPAIIQEPDPETGAPAVVLWPERWPYEKLAEIRKSRPHTFEVFYQGLPRPTGGGLFDAEMFRRARDTRLKAWRGYRDAAAEGVEDEGYGRINPVTRAISLDPTISRDFGITIADVNSTTGEVWILATFRKPAESDPNTIIKMVLELIRKYRCEYFVMEESLGFDKWLKVSRSWPEIKATKVRYVGHKTGSNKNALHTGLLSLADECGSGRLHFPYADEAGRAFTDEMEQEVLLYEPGGKGYPSDALMSLWFIRFNIKKLRPFIPLTQHVQTRGELNASGRAAWDAQHGLENTSYSKRQQQEAHRKRQEALAEDAWRAKADDAAYATDELEGADA